MSWLLQDAVPPLNTEVKWVGSCIVLVSLVYTYTLSRLSIVPGPLMPPPPFLPPASRARQLQDYHELQARKRRLARSPFRLRELPPEIRLLILGHCAEWPGTFSSLVLVSKQMQYLAHVACLPRMPIRLIDERHVKSFDHLLQQNPQLAPAVGHLWITPLHEAYHAEAAGIVKRCTNIRSLAVTGRMLQESVTLGFAGHQIRHQQCRELTLLYTSDPGWSNLINTPSGLKFFRQLSHLRLVGERIPSFVSLSELVAISYAFDPSSSNTSFQIGEQILQDKERFPKLGSVILVRERPYGTSVRIWRKKGTRVSVFEVPLQRTELELWCDNALGKGFWQLCSGSKAP